MPKEFDKMVSAIKKQLKKDNPNLKEDELESRAYTIATIQWKKIHDGKLPSQETVDESLKLDEKGRIIVAENTKFYINGDINNIEE